jgi:hypothetical protein
LCKRPDCVLQLLRRPDAELVVQQPAAEVVLAERLDGVAVGEVNADECAMCAFAQGFYGERSEPRVKRLPDAPGFEVVLAKRIERAEA